MPIDPSEWLRSLPWCHIALTLSVGLNLLLLLAFVFRRAINGILVNLYSVWRTRTEEQRHVLRELYEKMDVLNHDYLFMLVTSGMIHSAQTDAQRQILLDQQHAISPRLGATRTFLADHELEFPREVRQLVEKLRMELVLPSVQAADDVSAILRHSEVLTRVTRAIKTAVSECMRGSPWLRMRMIRRRDGHASKV